MTIEQKAKAYDEAIGRAKEMCTTILNRAISEYIFPELKVESENERVRKGLIELVKQSSEILEKKNQEQMIAWIEKQGKSTLEVAKEEKIDNQNCVKSYAQEHIGDAIDPKFKVGDLIKFSKEPKYPAREIISIKNDGYYFDSAVYLPFKRQDDWELVEQKPASKIKPKFKVGDFLVNDYCMGRVVELTDDAYLLDTEQGIPFSCEHNTHLWTIQDAKDGDVLVCPKYAGDIIPNIFIFKGIKIKDNDVFCYCSFLETFRTESYIANADPINTDFYPATKEQHDLLFQKMHEAGYEWDEENKELKEIAQNSIDNYCVEHCKGYQETGKCFADGECKAKRDAEQKPTDEEMKILLQTEYEKGRADAIAEMQKSWSEEDEKMLNDILMCGECHCYLDAGNIAWLKSLKYRVQPQSQWKPSKGQMKALWNVYQGGKEQAELATLYNDLKKLREE